MMMEAATFPFPNSAEWLLERFYLELGSPRANTLLVLGP
jgi:hypothetical protein